jgi:filamentous hemagglutinin family protein
VISKRQTPARSIAVALIVAPLTLIAPALAQHITIDGSLSPAQTLTGPNYAIGANLGKQVGGNLFQSFGIFGLSSGESATFSGPANVSNVIGRVTGGSFSSVNGAINSTISGANVYLINPAGFVFGPNATVNVSGSFRAASADYLKTSDGARFQATNPGGSTLSAAAPAAFGFLNAAPGAITVNGATLGVASGQTLGLAGGAVNVTGATLQAPAGAIHVTSVASTGEVPVAAGNGPATITSHGTVNITQKSLLNVSDPTNLGSGGSIHVHAGNLTVDNSEINADNYGAGSAGNLLLAADNQLTLSDGAFVHAFAQASGNGPPVILQTGGAGNVLIDDSQAFTGSFGTGNGGILSIQAGALTIANQGLIGGEGTASGNSGNVSLQLNGNMSITGPFAGIEAFTTTGSSGNAGTIAVNAGSVSLVDAQISSNTGGSGTSGNVSFQVAGRLSINVVSPQPNFLVGIASHAEPGSTGDAEQVTVSAGNLSMSAGGEISSSTFSSGKAGSVVVNVADLLSINGLNAAPGIATGIAAQTNLGSTGNGGLVSVTAGSLAISNGGTISAATFGPGAGGAVSVGVPGPLSITGSGSAITSQAFSSSGSAGSVNINAGSLALGNGGKITSQTVGSGAGGDVVIDSGEVTLTGPATQISALSSGTGEAGSITVSATNMTLQNGGAITTQAASANGGDIDLSVGNFLYLVKSQISTSVLGSNGNGGNITIDPLLLVLDSSSIIAQAVAGHGGNITIVANNFLPSDDSIVSASSQLGISGSIELIGPRVDLNGSLVVLSADLRSAADVLRTSCEAHGRKQSRLVDKGYGGLPQDTESAIPALYIVNRDIGLDTGPAAAKGAAWLRDPLLPPLPQTAHLTMDCD